jgi:hypothetical protein
MTRLYSKVHKDKDFLIIAVSTSIHAIRGEEKDNMPYFVITDALRSCWVCGIIAPYRQRDHPIGGVQFS